MIVAAEIVARVRPSPVCRRAHLIIYHFQVPRVRMDFVLVQENNYFYLMYGWIQYLMLDTFERQEFLQNSTACLCPRQIFHHMMLFTANSKKE